jgi:hypothetical protein
LVETPESREQGQTVEASSVWELDYQDTYKSIEVIQKVGQAIAVGQAVQVDLGPRGRFFVLMRGPRNSSLAGTLRAMMPGTTFRQQVEALPHSGVLELANKRDWPWFVRFSDLNNPMSVELVDPENLAATFGEGVKLLRLTFQYTKEPLTTGIEKILPWLDRPGRLDGKRIHDFSSLANDLGSGDFRIPIPRAP